jgi:hypothetical protein
MSEASQRSDFEVLQTIIPALQPLDKADQARILQAAIIFLGLQHDLFGKSDPQGSGNKDIPAVSGGHRHPGSGNVVTGEDTGAGGYFSDRQNISAKEFLLDKEPRSDVERVACLAYYLTHYRNVREFKNLDLSLLNTEAAQVKFSNLADAVANATKLGFLVPSSSGMKQLGAIGEQVVRALPDRDAAKAARAKARLRRPRKTTRSSSPESHENHESGEP